MTDDAGSGSDDIGAFVPGQKFRIAGRAGGPLSGLTFAAKDLFDVAGHPTGGGNPDWARTNPVPERHAWAVQRLLDAGKELKAQGADAILLDCIGFTERHRHALLPLGLPVILSNAVAAKALSELLGG